DVVKNERRQRYDNVPYGTAFEKLTALSYPEGRSVDRGPFVCVTGAATPSSAPPSPARGRPSGSGSG
ncbi:hypothetical protein ACWDE9_25755, partial [Streptomyces olivaceoviridis]